jgi:hypothetical protein
VTPDTKNDWESFHFESDEKEWHKNGKEKERMR